jgi:hypothetical protein
MLAAPSFERPKEAPEGERGLRGRRIALVITFAFTIDADLLLRRLRAFGLGLSEHDVVLPPAVKPVRIQIWLHPT